MRFILALLLLCCPLFAQATAPTLNCTLVVPASTLSPRQALLDCSATTGGTNPFRNLYYRHSLGDPSSGNWSNGTNTSASKNFATGPIAAHVYECAVATCNYTISTLVCNSAYECSRASYPITVTGSFNRVFCLTTGADFTSCPGSATQIPLVTELGTTIAANMGAGDVQFLARCGDTFTISISIAINQSTGYLGKYGTCADPIITSAGAPTSYFVFSGVGKSDWRFVDLDITNTNAALSPRGWDFTKRFDNVTILRVTMANFGLGFFLNQPTMGDYEHGLFVVDGTFTRPLLASGGSAGQRWFYMLVHQSAFMGNSFDGHSFGEHVWRMQQLVTVVIQHNTLANPAPTKEVITIRANPHVTTSDDSRYIIVSYNDLSGGAFNNGVDTNPWTMSITPESGTDDERILDIIVEKNHYRFVGGTSVGTQIGLRAVPYQRLTVRDNFFNTSGGKAHQGIDIGGLGLVPNPDDIAVDNNTVYSGDTDTDFIIANFGSEVTNAVARNNLGYAPNDSQHWGISCDNTQVLATCTGLTASNNSTTAQVGATDPLFDNVASFPLGARIGAGSYAATGGTAVYPAANADFYDCDRNTGNTDLLMGAFRPRTRARCSSAPLR